MFTGLVEGMGCVLARSDEGGEVRLRVGADFLARAERGESLAVDGVCLTSVQSGEGWFEAVVSPETLARTTLGGRAKGETVNLERPLRLGDRLGGHLVQGHVDAVAVIASVQREGSGSRLRIACGDDLGPYVVLKGSIAVDGVSLTVAARGEGWFEVALIPETLLRTTLGRRGEGDKVNLEVDLIGRYVVEALNSRWAETASAAGRARQDAPALTRAFLAEHGFAGLDAARAGSPPADDASAEEER